MAVPSTGRLYLGFYVELNTKLYTGQIFTLSYLMPDNKFVTNTFTAPTELPADHTMIFIHWDYSIKVEVWSYNNKYLIQFNNSSGIDNITLSAIKLEVGEGQTLCYKDSNNNWQLIDPPPNKTEQLWKCQRYLQPMWVLPELQESYSGPNNTKFLNNYYVPNPPMVGMASIANADEVGITIAINGGGGSWTNDINYSLIVPTNTSGNIYSIKVTPPSTITDDIDTLRILSTTKDSPHTRAPFLLSAEVF